MDRLSNLKETLKSIDNSIDEKKLAVKRGEQLARLRSNSDFVDVIMNGYLKAEELKLFNLLTNPVVSGQDSDEVVKSKLASIRDLKKYLGTETIKGTIEIEAERAPLDIATEEEYRKAVTAEFSSIEG